MRNVGEEGAESAEGVAGAAEFENGTRETFVICIGLYCRDKLADVVLATLHSV